MSPPQVLDRFPAWFSAALSSARPFLNGSSAVKPAFKPSLPARERISPAQIRPYRSRSICARFHHTAPAHRMGQCCGHDSPGGTPDYSVQKCVPEYHVHLARPGRLAHRRKRVCIPPPAAAESGLVQRVNAAKGECARLAMLQIQLINTKSLRFTLTVQQLLKRNAGGSL